MIFRTWQAAIAVIGVAATSYLLWPKDPDLAEANLRAGMAQEAIRILERESRFHPGDDSLGRKLVAAYEQARRFDEAMALLEAAGRARPLTAAEREQGRRIGLAMGRPRRALALLTGPHEVVAMPEAPILVDLALMANDLGMARRLQQVVVASAPQSVVALDRLRDLALAQSDLAGALEAQRRVRALTPTYQTTERLVSLLLQAGRASEALDELEKMAPHAELVPWHQRAAQLAEWTRQPARAVPHLKALYRATPDLAMGKRLLGAFAAAHSPETMALALSLAEGHPEDEALQRNARSLLLASGRVAEALESCRREVLRSPDGRTAHGELVSLALGNMRQNLAIAELRRWLFRHPADHDEWHRLGQALGWEGNSEAAGRIYARLLTTQGLDLPPAKERRWREEWLGLASPLDDVTPPLMASLERMLELRPDRLDLRRRLAAAAMEVGDRARALFHQRLAASHPHATAEDRAGLARWLLWDGRLPEATALLEHLAPGHPYDPSLWREAASVAERRELWAQAAQLLNQVARRAPGEADLWEELAQVEEQKPDLPAAAVAWQHRLLLGHVHSDERLAAAALLKRLGQPLKAYAVLRTGSSLAEWHERSELASQLGLMGGQEDALRELLRINPSDRQAHLTLADLLDRSGRDREALGHDEVALRLSADDPGVMAQVAARRFYGRHPDTAAPLIVRLASVREPSQLTLRLLADYYQDRVPVRAIAALDLLHAHGGGGYDTWFRRGELASGVGDRAGATRAWRQAETQARSQASRPEAAEVLAMAAERLGDPQAPTLWDDLASRFPDRIAPTMAVARYQLRRGAIDRAAPFVARALRLDPASVEARLLQVEWLEAAHRPADMLAVIGRLRRDKPEWTFLIGTEALALRDLGRLRAARLLVRDAIDRYPSDASFLDLYRSFQEDGAHQLEGFGWHEQTGLLDHSAIGTRFGAVLSDRLRLLVDTSHHDWSGGVSPMQEAALGLHYQIGGLVGTGQLALDQQDGRLQSPLGRVTVAWRNTALGFEAIAQEGRWEDTVQTVSQQGRERQLSGEASWQLLPVLRLKGLGGIGQLSLAGTPVGVAHAYLTELTIRPVAEGPWSLTYQWQQRAWGAAGSLVGLPEAISLHSALLSYSNRWGGWRTEIQPGYSIDANSGAASPLVTGLLAWELTPDVAIGLDGAYSWRSLAVGGSGGYQRLNMGAHWRF